MASTRRSRALGAVFLVAALWVVSGPAFIPAQPPREMAPAAAGTLAASFVASPAFAGGPPSVGEHWYWNLPFGANLHGDVVSVLLFIFTILLAIAVLGAGGSSRKAGA